GAGEITIELVQHAAVGRGQQFSQATAPRKGGVTNEAVTSARMVCRPGMSVRDTSQPIGAATMQQITAEVVAMIAVVSNGSRKSGLVNSVTKFCSVGYRALSVKA